MQTLNYHNKSNLSVTNIMLNKLKPTIAVVDSGIGGISVLNQLIQKYKFGNFLYFADNLHMPYGNKKSKFIEKRLEQIIQYLNKFYCPDMIIIACNTASSVVDCSKYDNVKTILFDKSNPILATKLTSKQLAGFNVIADKNLASLIEHKINKPTLLLQNIKEHAKKLKLNKYPILTLGCTHYELIKDMFEKVCPNTKFILNSAKLIEQINFAPEQNYLTIKLLLSKKDERCEKLINSLIKTNQA